MEIRLLLIIIVCGCLCCSHRTQSKNGTNNSIEVKRKVLRIDRDTLNWKRDTCGCLNLRDLDMLDRIIDRYHLVGRDTTTIITFLGHPNDFVINDKELSYIYYLGRDCIDLNPDFSTDKSWVYLHFDLKFKLMGKPNILCVE